MTFQRTISPVDGSVYVERTLAAPAQIEAALENARLAQLLWRSVPMTERAAILGRGIASRRAAEQLIAAALNEREQAELNALLRRIMRVFEEREAETKGS